jgi:hypothetical protein
MAGGAKMVKKEHSNKKADTSSITQMGKTVESSPIGVVGASNRDEKSSLLLGKSQNNGHKWDADHTRVQSTVMNLHDMIKMKNV